MRRTLVAIWLAYLFRFHPERFHVLSGIFRGPDQAASGARRIFIERARFVLYLGAKHGHAEREAPFLSYKKVRDVVDELKAIGSPVASCFMYRVKHGLKVLASFPLLSRAEREELEQLSVLAGLLLRKDWVAVLDWYDSFPWKW